MLDTPTTHIAPTADELARRARCRELRDLIAKEVIERRAIKAAYRLPHGSAENKAAMAAAAALVGIKPAEICAWNWHCTPGRDWGKAYVTTLYVELAKLRGKVHLTAKAVPA